MKKTWMKVAFVVALAGLLIAASIDIKNSGVLVTNGYVVAPVSVPDGTAAAPSVKFTTDPNSGLYSAGADQVGVSANGVVSGKFTTTGLDLSTLDLTCNQATATYDAIGIVQGTTPANEFAGVKLTNTTAATGAVKVQVSPSLVWHGTADNTAVGDVSETHDWRAYVLPVTNAGATQSKWILGQSFNGGAYAKRIAVDGALLNASIGFGAHNAMSTGAYGVAVGNLALAQVSNGDYDTAVGDHSLYSVVSGGQNTSVGAYSLYSTTGSSCLGLGLGAGRYETGSFAAYIDTIGRTTEALGKVNSLIYGVMNATTTGSLQNIALNGNVITQNAAAFGGGERRTVVTKLTTNATAFNIWENTNTVVLATGAIPSVVTALVAETCVNIKARCTAVDKADTAGNGSWEYADLCCNKGGTTTCSAGATAIRAVATGTLATATVAIAPCNTVAGACTTADAPGVTITGVAATNVNWKCVIDTFVTDNT